MRIVVLNQFYAPDEAATAQMLGDLGSGLAAAGHQVTAICSDRSYAQPRKRYPLRQTIDGVSIERVRSTGFGRGTVIGRACDYVTFMIAATMHLLRTKRPDVVVVLTTPPMIAYAALQVRRFRKFRLVFWSMDVYPQLAFELGALKPNSWLGRLLRRISRRVLESSDIVVALGETMAERLLDLGAHRVRIIQNWADETAIVAASQRVLRTEWKWDGRFVVLYSGNLGLAHEFDTVLAAARRLQDTDPAVLFAFIGVGPRLGQVKEGARQLKNVEFRDYVERSRLRETLPAADVHLTTLKPGMPGLLVPSKIYGILAAGRPTIYVGPDDGEIARILRENDCGTSLRNDDVDGLVKAIRDYRSDRPRVEREGKNARAIFEKRFTRTSGVAAFREMLESL